MLRTTFSLIGLLMLTTPLSAQQQQERDFESLMESGLGMREQGRDAEALELFTQCLELQPDSGQAIGQVAFAEMALGRLVLAEAHLHTALGCVDDPWVTRHRQALEDAQLSLATQIATVEIPVEGAEVTFTESGRARTRRTPVTLRLSPGQHQLRVTAPGFLPALTTLTIEAGQSLTHLPTMRPSVVTTTREPIILANPSDSNVLLTTPADPTRYLVRSIRLDVSATIFAVGCIGTGVAALLIPPQRNFRGGPDSRSTANWVLIGSAIASAGMALVLFISARAVRTKYRRASITPTF